MPLLRARSRFDFTHPSSIFSVLRKFISSEEARFFSKVLKLPVSSCSQWEMNPLENAKSPFRVCSSVGILILSVLDSITHPHAMSVAIRFAAAKKSNNI